MRKENEEQKEKVAKKTFGKSLTLAILRINRINQMLCESEISPSVEVVPDYKATLREVYELTKKVESNLDDLVERLLLNGYEGILKESDGLKN